MIHRLVVPLLFVLLLAPRLGHGESLPAPVCTCDDECAQYSYAGPYCQTYGQGWGYCSWSGPGTPCPGGEPWVTFDPGMNPDFGLPEPPTWPEPPNFPEPGYPESDPWYEDIGGVRFDRGGYPGLDGGPPVAGDGELGLVERGGCSLGGPGGLSPALLLVALGLLLVRRRARAQR